MQPKSQPYAWKNVEIVGGGFVTGIVFHPAQRDVLYARTDIGGAYRWETKTRRWQPLQDWLEKKDWNLIHPPGPLTFALFPAPRGRRKGEGSGGAGR